MTYFYTSVDRYKNDILLRGWRDGSPVKKKIRFQPTLYCQSKNPSRWTSLDEMNVEPIKMDSMYDSKSFLDQYKDIDGFKVYGNTNYVVQYITETWPKEIQFDYSQINILNIDIEVASDEGFPEPEQANHEVISIAVKSSKNENFIVWALQPFDVNKSQYDNVDFRLCKDEKHLLQEFMLYWVRNYPDIVTGWNVRMFDMPYLINRAIKMFGNKIANKFSPWDLISQREVRYKNKTVTIYDMTGISQMDYFDLFQKFGYSYGPQESYALNHIAYVVLGERKLSYEEYGNLYTLYKEDHQKFIDYNIRDVDLVDRIDDKTGLMSLALTMAYKAGVNYNDTLGTTAIWDSIIYRYLTERNVAIWPNIEKPKTEYPGGFVKEPQVGRHDWVCSFDLNSLYPNLIIQYNMSPETIVNDKWNNKATVAECMNGMTNDTEYAMAANGVYFRKDRLGVLPAIVEQMYNERVTIKGKMIEAQKRQEAEGKSYEVERDIAHYENQQMAIKILLNSLYGALGNKYFRYFDQRVAEGITLSGQLSILVAERAINNYLNKVMKTKKDYVVAIDTDSVYLDLSDLVEKTYKNKPTEQTINYLDKVCGEAIEPVIAKGFDDLSKQMNAYSNRMVMKREALADRGIWTAKKRYILNVHDNEGVRYAEPKLKIMGIEAIKSSTPEICRNKFKDAFKLLMNGTNKDLQIYISNFKEEFFGCDPEQVAFPRGVSNLKQYRDKTTVYKKATPIHVRGSLLYNNRLEGLNLSQKYNKIAEGEKIKFLYLNVPNPLGENVVAFPDVLPKEFELHRYVDYETQFEKTFTEPLKIILDSIGWTVEETATLESFF